MQYCRRSGSHDSHLVYRATCTICNQRSGGHVSESSFRSTMRRSALLVLFATPLSAVKLPTPTGASPLYAHVLRLQPGDDLVDALLDHCQGHTISAATVMSCVGSLSNVALRMAGAEEVMLRHNSPARGVMVSNCCLVFACAALVCAHRSIRMLRSWRSSRSPELCAPTGSTTCTAQ